MSTELALQPTTPTTSVSKAAREVRAVQDTSEISYLMDTGRFEHCYRVAGAMARASLIPKHLKGDSFEQTQANCFLIVNQAMRWKLDPFAIAPETYEVGGKLAFQGKLVAAVINARGGLAERLSYTFNDGKGDALEVTVSGRIDGEEAPRTVSVTVGQAKTTNQMWTKDPHQKLIYTGAVKWARRHKPEVILGVLTDDDAEQIREEQRFMAATPVKVPQFPEPPQITTPPTPAAEKKSRAKKEPAPAPLPDDGDLTPATPTPEPVKEKSFEEVVDGVNPAAMAVTKLSQAIEACELTEEKVLAFCESKKLFIEGGDRTLGAIRPDKIEKLIANLPQLAEQIRGL